MAPLAPLAYRPGTVGRMTVLAYDPSGHGRVVEVLGNLDQARHVAVLVPGNAHALGNYLTASGGAAPRANGLLLYRTLLAETSQAAVVVWLGYRCPKGFVAGALRHHARRAAHDLARLTHRLPGTATVTLVGHSYGTLVCAEAAVAGARVDDLVALASPGLGVWRVDELRTTARVWAARSQDDWVRFVPPVRLGRFGHGRQPAHPRFGARVFSSRGATGHSGYYTPGSESLANLARIVLGLHDHVTVMQAAEPVRTGRRAAVSCR